MSDDDEYEDFFDEIESYFINKRVMVSVSGGPLECVVVDVIEEAGCTFYYRVLLDDGKYYHIPFQDIDGITILEDIGPKIVKGI